MHNGRMRNVPKHIDLQKTRELRWRRVGIAIAAASLLIGFLSLCVGLATMLQSQQPQVVVVLVALG